MDNYSENKRRFIRAQFPCKIIVRIPDQKIITTRTENIGAGGVRVLIEEQLSIGSLVDLELYIDNDPIASEGRIVWVISRDAPEGEARYDTGIEFYRIQETDRRIIDIFVSTVVTKKEE